MRSTSGSDLDRGVHTPGGGQKTLFTRKHMTWIA